MLKNLIKIVAFLFLTGCVSRIAIQDMAYVIPMEEEIEFLVNNTAATVKWKRAINPSKRIILKAKSNSNESAGEYYLIDSSPAVGEEEIFVPKNGELLGLKPKTEDVIHRYNVKKILKKDVVMDDFILDAKEPVFSFAYHGGVKKYITFSGSKPIVQKYGRGESSVQFVEFHKGKLILGNLIKHGTINLLNPFKEKWLWKQPKIHSLKDDLKKMIKGEKGAGLIYDRLVDVVFSRKDEIIIGLFSTKDKNWFIEAYSFQNGKSLWTKKLVPGFTGDDLDARLMEYKNVVVLVEFPHKWDGKQLISTMNQVLNIADGVRIGTFKGIVNFAKRIDGGIYFTNRENKGYIFSFASRESKEVALRGMNILYGLNQIKEKWLYFNSENSSGTARSLENRKPLFAVKGYNQIRAVRAGEKTPLWSLLLSPQTQLPVIYEEEGIIAIGDPLGQGRESHLAYIQGTDLSDTALLIDGNGGKILWKAKIKDGKIARLAVWKNMAFIKTLKGNLFAVEWPQSYRFYH